MGNCFGNVCRKRPRRNIVLMLIGLDNAGKTKTVNNLTGEKEDTVPTVGFKGVNLIHKDTPVTIYDLGGSAQFRQLWSQYYSEVHGIIFVIDSSDFSRLDECKAVLEEVLSHDKVSGKPILVLANKQDKRGALDDIDVVEKLNIEPLVNRYRCPTLVESYSAAVPNTKSKKPKLDPGLKKGYQWLLNYIIRRYGDINLRVQTDIHTELERRKRMMQRATNRASQTFTAVSDDIATQTGFANPNYQTLSRNPDKLDDQKDLDTGVIIVKPAAPQPNSLDTTVTIESSDGTSKPKLSPLFGRASDSNESERRIELEAKSAFRKLSPIVRNKSGPDQHINFQNRAQSSPKNASTDSQSQQTPNDVSRDAGVDSSYDSKQAIHVSDAALSQGREIFYERTNENKTASSEIVASSSRSLPNRPASASQIVRKQLEISANTHKRRLSLRYMYRNKTSPERPGLFHFEPGKGRHLDKGDFETVMSGSNHRDVGL